MKIEGVMRKHDQWERRRQYVAERRTYREISSSRVYNGLDSFVKIGNHYPVEERRSVMTGRSMGDLTYLCGPGVNKMGAPDLENMFKLSVATLHKLGYLHSSHTAAGLVGKALRNIGTNRDDKLYAICERFAKQLTEPREVAVNLNESM